MKIEIMKIFQIINLTIKFVKDLIELEDKKENERNYDDYKELNHQINRPTPFNINMDENYKPKLTLVNCNPVLSFNEVFAVENFTHRY